ncbi:hypothetical protein [Brevundimonas sp. TWP2-3-4b1]|uniref:hypothetical protein n=1 Tax=Brevundimonas sp. TWP2-3-4b1 TaxID=2804580 RepID=UPI003CF7C326
MTLPFRCLPIALIACTTMTASCAGSRPISSVAPPRLSLPAMASRPCELHRLPAAPTLGDLEVGYMIRGRQIADCDVARRLAVDTLLSERRAGEAAKRP